MPADVADFAEESFDPITYINQACTSRPNEEPLEKFLAELEMRLQLTAEDIEATLSDHSAQAMRRIPFAIQEIYRLQGDIQGMQDQVQVMAHTVQRDATDARGSVGHIGQLHRVKANMENAVSSLKEATELSGLFVKVEEVFAAGDLPKVAEILASMRRSLSLVGDVPEFRA
ncbi:Conserved oligomeric Golgi complex subunit 7, partial [Tetrabaena socialis]